MPASKSLALAPSPAPSVEFLGWMALAGSLAAIAWSPLFARFSEIGPLATGFWRMAFACPLLFAWAGMSPVSASPRGLRGVGWALTIVAGLAFAADLGTFHLALTSTSVANVSFLGNLSSLFVILGGALLFRERVRPAVWAALAVSLLGAWVMSGAVTDLEGLRSGDLLAVVAAAAYAVYLLAMKAAGRSLSSGVAMARSSLVCALALLVAAVAAGETILPATLEGWLPLIALGILTHSLGQGLTAVALGRLPMAPVALAVLVQPILTTLLANLILGEVMTGVQIAGSGLILAGILVARLR